MRSKKELWEIVQREFEKDLKDEQQESHCICDIILDCEPDYIVEDEMNSLLDEMEEYANDNNLRKGSAFWKVEDIESRREFIKDKIRFHEVKN